MLKIDSYRIKKFLKGLLSPITIMFIPHSSRKSIGLKLPSLGIFLIISIWILYSCYVFSTHIEKKQYEAMEQKLASYKEEFIKVQESIQRLKEAEGELLNLISHGNKERIFKSLKDVDESGTVNIDDIKEQILESLERVDGLKDYIHEQKNIYLSTPRGWPMIGRVTSEFGMRESPYQSTKEQHNGIDISAPKGTNIYVTADGIVSYSGWSKGNGNMIIVEHGMGYRTLYAHNSKNLVKEGQKVKRGDLIALAGATGNATGSHLHYEVWFNDRPVNPFKYISAEVRDVSKKE